MTQRKIKLMEMENVRLVDDVAGRMGTVKYVKYGVETSDPNISEGAVVGFQPDIDVFKRFWKIFTILGKSNIVEIGPFPAEAVNHETVQKREQGQPSEIVHIANDLQGNSPFRDRLGDKTDSRVQRLQKENERLRAELDSTELDKMELEQESEFRGDKPKGQKQTESSQLDDLSDL